MTKKIPLLAIVWVSFAFIIWTDSGIALEFKAPIISKETVDQGQEIRFYLRVPKSQVVEGVLVALYAGFETAPKRLNHGIDLNQSGSATNLIKWAIEHRFAVLTWDTQFMRLERRWWGIPQADLNNSLRSERDRFVKHYCDVMNRGMLRICDDNQLPKTNYIISGNSKGTIWGERFLSRHPDRFVAAIFHNGHGFEQNCKGYQNVAILYSSGESDFGNSHTLKQYRKHIDNGGVGLFHVAQSIGHAYPNWIEQLHCQYLDFVFNRETESRVETIRDSVQAANWYFDCVNMEVFDRAQKENIPVAQRIPIPSRKLKQFWMPR